jgi:hypothetical protein
MRIKFEIAKQDDRDTNNICYKEINEYIFTSTFSCLGCSASFLLICRSRSFRFIVPFLAFLFAIKY